MKNKVALVLEGGGFRGCYTAGAMQWLYDHEITFPYVVSISATAVYSFYYCTGEMEALYDLSVKGVSDPHMVGLKAVLSEGALVGYTYMRDHYVKKVYDRSLEKLLKSDVDFEFGVYNMTQQHLQYKNKYDLDPEAELLKASCVLPISGRMTPVNGEKYLDGGIDTMVSVRRAKEKGYDKQLVIVTKDKNYVRKPNSWPVRTLLRILYHNYPGMLDQLDKRTQAYYDQMDSVYQLENEGNGVLIRPSRDCGVGRFSGTNEQLEEMFRLGYSDMEDNKDAIFKLMGISKKKEK
ncbi:MAG: patatin-like phospholipase family protein [Erysipelotrichaceae bacterium]|nr:patatin-like phospholipase family protein [Erysipelotrichaceae bacterium]